MFKQYLLPGLGIALAVALAAVAVQTARVGKAKAELATLQLEYATLLDVTTGKDDTIARLETAVSQAQTLANEQAADMLKAGVVIANYQGLISAQAKALAEAEKADYDKPDCERLLATDLALTCPAHSNAIRTRSNRALQN